MVMVSPSILAADLANPEPDDVNPGCCIEVDGNVDVLVAGSAYFEAKNRGEFVRLIQG